MVLKKLLQEFENFLATIPLEKYREELLPIKRVEQDLPRDLNPLPSLYSNYWKPEALSPSFPDYEQFFNQWWEDHLKPVDSFIKQFFGVAQESLFFAASKPEFIGLSFQC